MTSPEPGLLLGRHCLNLGRAEDALAALPDFLDAKSFRATGCWHSHTIRDATPSRADLNAWAARLYLNRSLPAWATLIVLPDGPGQQFHGFVTRRELGENRYTVEPCVVKGRYV